MAAVMSGLTEDEKHTLATMEPDLSPFELQAFGGYLEGKSYKEVSAETGRSIKSVDNALQRVKRKLESKLGVLQ